MENLGIYVHIPFCKQKCRYCDFTSFSNRNEYINEYVKAVLYEIDAKAEKYNLNGEKLNIDTIYIGGGTPSIISEQYIEEILNKIRQKFNVLDNAEITIEVNPGTVNEDKLKKYLQAGINRISIGLQSSKDELLKMLGRIHTYEQFEQVYEMVRNVGYKNVNVDLMIGLPNQTLSDVQDTLNKIVLKNPEHISVYSLIVEENTMMNDLIEKNILKLPDEELERKMYWNVKETLQKNGYIHYEISNFAKPGFESKHNSNCWDQHSYIGLGLAAHSYFDGVRFSNTENLKDYIRNCNDKNYEENVVVHEKQDKNKMMNEYMLLGLRKINGINICDFNKKFSCEFKEFYKDKLTKLQELGLIELENNNIKLTNKGLDLANQVWIEFI